jgi:hypothetical protein
VQVGEWNRGLAPERCYGWAHVTYGIAGRRGTHASARSLASGIEILENQDDETLDEIFCKASALYQAAYAPCRRGETSSDEALIRMALPWHVVPTLLARMKMASSPFSPACAAFVALDGSSGPRPIDLSFLQRT